MGRTACTEPQCLYKGGLYLTFTFTFTLQLYCSNKVNCSCAQITQGSAANLILADNKKVSLKCALSPKMITQVNTTILFFAFTHPVISGKDRKRDRKCLCH